MSDEDLRGEVERANNLVFIGFKEAEQVEGVDGRGRVLVSDATVLLGKEAVRNTGATFRFEFDDMPSMAAVIDPADLSELRRNPVIEYIEPVTTGRRLSQDTTWNVKKVNAPPAWVSTTGGGEKLLIIDSGIQENHFDLYSPVVGLCDTTVGLWDVVGHGTEVAGIAAATDNSIGIIGVSHGVSLWIAKDGDEEPSALATACGVQMGRANGVAAINISTGFDDANVALTDQINYAYYTDDILVVAAAGNDAGAVAYPASLAAVVAVSATTSSDTFASSASPTSVRRSSSLHPDSLL